MCTKYRGAVSFCFANTNPSSHITSGALGDQGVHIVLTDTTMLEFKVSDKPPWGEARSLHLKELLKDHKQGVPRRSINSSYCRSAMGEPRLSRESTHVC